MPVVELVDVGKSVPEEIKQGLAGMITRPN
jgi:hypothetical protein